MSANKADFTLTFRRLAYAAASAEADKEVRVLFSDPTSYDDWAVKWRTRLSEESESGQARAAAMRAVNPLFIPRNHLVEGVIQAAVQRQDFQPFHDLLDVVTRPYEDRPGLEKFTAPARPEEQVLETFCGT